MNHEHLKPVIQSLPNKPGVYQYYDKEGKLIYVGKAKISKNGFLPILPKITTMPRRMYSFKKFVEIKHIVVNTRIDALLLENSLIKKYQPQYNIMLKDDKTYPWICIKNEAFPRVFLTRNVIKTDRNIMVRMLRDVWRMR